MNLGEGRTPKFYARDGTLRALSAAVRERRRQARLAYTFDPGLALAERAAADHHDPADAPGYDEMGQ